VQKFADPTRSRQAETACFGEIVLPSSPSGRLRLELLPRHANALAGLLPLLSCGEESAVLSFARHARSESWAPRARRDFARIESDEKRHAYWLQRLQISLPAPGSESDSRRGAVKRFFMRLGSPDLALHLGHIAALDSAVCLILGKLRRTPACASDTRVSNIFAHIHHDEARHVAIARHYARELRSSCELSRCAAETRERLAALLSSAGAEAFETLGVCPDDLLRRLRTPPQRLFE
jgi:rubrerythrin